LKTDAKGARRVELGGGLIFPAIISGGISADSSSDIEVNVDKFYFFNNWLNGWTEGTFDASGKLLLKKTDGGYECVVVEKPEILDIRQGNIRYIDDYFTGDKGMSQVKNRFERIKSVNSFLKENGFPEFYSHVTKNILPDEIKTVYFDKLIDEKITSESDRNFIYSLYNTVGEEYLMKKDITEDDIFLLNTMLFDKYKIRNSYKSGVFEFLFPELTFSSVLYKTDKYKASSKDLQYGNSVLWNKNYTEAVFPDHLKALRNSGSLYRDFEESLPLFFIEYNFNYYFDKYINNRIFHIKK
jgi:hypothetical protein